MAHVKTLLETYAAADETERLSMYLTYRDLRRRFIQIDLAPENSTQWVPLKQRRLFGGRLRWPDFTTLCCKGLRQGR